MFKQFSNESSQKQNFNVLILTATITPPSGVPLLARTDPKARLQDYEKGLQFYLQFLNKGIDAIVFAENSNSDVSTLKNIVTQSGLQDAVEFLVFDGLDYPLSHGRAYGEFKLVDYVMEHSQTISIHKENLLVWKVTGRYIIRNMAKIIAHKPPNIDIYVNSRKFPKPWADMYLLVWTMKAYETFFGKIRNDMIAEPSLQFHPEQAFIKLLEKPPRDLKVKRRFNVTPLIDGARGSDNQDYSEGSNLRKYYIRSIMNKLVPWLWI
ncbi:MAG: hypothetical protein AUK48_01725 [Oscillatoriales cyanobacterium CG2_30_44_21]|nr:MAG: hypothetical protein AUK48_01725 [Oscillatoriales cyanobacterium CG2_30_44_21]